MTRTRRIGRNVVVTEKFLIGRSLPHLSVIEACREIAKDLSLTPQDVYNVYAALDEREMVKEVAWDDQKVRQK